MPCRSGALLLQGATPNLTTSAYFKAATTLYSLVSASHAAGETVPLWGTCLGVQTISCIAAGGQFVLGQYPLYGYACKGFLLGAPCNHNIAGARRASHPRPRRPGLCAFSGLDCDMSGLWAGDGG